MATKKKTEEKPVPEQENPTTETVFRPIRLQWMIVRPDTRQYKQQSMELCPMNALVEVDVPTGRGYIIPQITIEDSDKIILTPAGMRYVQDQLEELYADTAPENFGKDVENDFEDDSDDWEDDDNFSDSENNSSEVSSDTDDWDDADFDDDEETESEDSKPDTEDWDEDEEDWE